MHYKYNPAQRVFASSGKSDYLSGDYSEAIYNNRGYDSMSSAPKQKNLFFVVFELHPFAQAFVDQQIVDLKQKDFDVNNISYFVKTAKRPDVNWDIETVHQYNRKRHHYTKLNYNDVNIEFYDDVGSTLVLFLQLYARYYYGDFDSQAKQSWWNYDMVTNSVNFETFSRGNWGYRYTNMGDKDETYFFKRISIVEIQGTTFTAYNINNPKIESYTLDEKTQDSSDPNIVNINFKHEGITNLYPDYNDSDFALVNAINTHVDAGELNSLSRLLFSETDPSLTLYNKHSYFIQESKFIDDNDKSFTENLLDAASQGASEVFETLTIFGLSEISDLIDSASNYLATTTSSNVDTLVSSTTSSFISSFSGSK